MKFKQIIIVFTPLLLVSCANINKKSSALEDIVKTVCRVRLTSEKKTLYGTGFVVEEGKIITLASNISGYNISGSKLEVQFYDWEYTYKSAFVVKEIEDSAFVLIGLDDGNAIKPKIKLVDKKCQIGETVYSIINVNDSSIALTKGIVSKVDFVESKNSIIGGKYIETSTPFYEGASGGPLLNEDFECIGFVSHANYDYNNQIICQYSYSLPASYALEFLKC